MAAKKTMDDLRETLFDTIDKVKSGQIDAEKAKTICEIGQVLVNSAKVEVEFQKNVGGINSPFIQSSKQLT